MTACPTCGREALHPCLYVESDGAPDLVGLTRVGAGRHRSRSPMCGCGHTIASHLPDGGCIGCTGTCDTGPFVVHL